jgi:hypothetical protein
MLSVILFYFNNGFSQNLENDYKIMVDSAISIKYREFLKSKDTPANVLPEEEFYLIDENNSPYRYDSQLTGFKFKTIDISKKNKDLKKGIRAWKVIALLRGVILEIRIIDFLITYDKGNYKFANGGGAKVIFKYLCNEEKWVLEKSMTQGL